MAADTKIAANPPVEGKKGDLACFQFKATYTNCKRPIPPIPAIANAYSGTQVGRKGISLSRGGKARAVRTGRLAKKNQEAGTPHRRPGLSGGEWGGRIEQGQHRLRLGVGGIEAQGGLRVGAGRRQLAVLVANHGAVGPGAGVGRRVDDVLVEKF